MIDLKELYLRKGSVAQDYIDIAQDFFVEINNYFKIIDCNLKFCKFMNKPRSDLFGANILEAIHERDKIRFQNIVRNALLRKFKESLIRLDLTDYKQRISTVSLKINPILDDSNNITGMFLKFSTYKLRMEDSEFSTLFMSIYNSLTDLYTIYGTDKKIQINHINTSLTNILGYKKVEMIGRHVADFLVKNKEQEENIKKLFKTLESTGKFSGEVYYQAKNGDEIPIHLSISSLIHNGKVIGSLGIGRDMREQKKLESENKSFALQVQNQSKLAEFGMMLQGVAHNMSTPLTGIKSSAQLQHSRLLKFKEKLVEKYGEDQEVKENITDIMKFFKLIDISVSKIAKIIKNLMSKSRDQQSITKEALNLSFVMEQELEFLTANQFFQNKIEKNFDIQSDIPIVYGLYSDFSQSFVNIVKNSIDAMWASPVKRMYISIHHEEDSIKVKIKDTGNGIHESIKNRIFEPFFTTKSKFKDAKGEEPTGTGIGLDSVKTLLKPYGAKISFESEVGSGTEFTIVIPVSENQQNSNN
ncbi:MAG: PAS domain-containing sensor histidine kinase [Candidatus Delongbacteria bacterium]|nr:PAS domain-containing sensor histidine kinase [Candidatus Delongbacteria bacterium]MCG2759874.1 PAS domain-containing sensor histidine kinase [Candidatus Delongbacteria bacterium]